MAQLALTRNDLTGQVGQARQAKARRTQRVFLFYGTRIYADFHGLIDVEWIRISHGHTRTHTDKINAFWPVNPLVSPFDCTAG